MKINNISNTLEDKSTSKNLPLQIQKLEYNVKNDIKKHTFDYKNLILDISTYKQLSIFIKLFKWKKNKLNYTYFNLFTSQYMKYIDNIKTQDKIMIFSDIFWNDFQNNKYDTFWNKFSALCSKDKDFKWLKFYIGWKLLKSPLSISEFLKFKGQYPADIFR